MIPTRHPTRTHVLHGNPRGWGDAWAVAGWEGGGVGCAGGGPGVGAAGSWGWGEGGLAAGWGTAGGFWTSSLQKGQNATPSGISLPQCVHFIGVSP